MEIRYLGHAAFTLTDGDTTVLIDPFLTGNPKAAVTADEVKASAILVTHGHSDHLGDTIDIAKRTGAPVLAITELAGEIGAALGEDHAVHDPNLGGTVTFDWGTVKVVPAWHTSTTPGGTANTPAGLVVTLGGTRVYHLGDTCLFSDLKLQAGADVAIVPIGGHYTMDRHDAVTAAELLEAGTIIPGHYGTFGLIETDAEAYKAEVEAATSTTVVVLAPGETHSA